MLDRFVDDDDDGDDDDDDDDDDDEDDDDDDDDEELPLGSVVWVVDCESTTDGGGCEFRCGCAELPLIVPREIWPVDLGLYYRVFQCLSAVRCVVYPLACCAGLFLRGFGCRCSPVEWSVD